MKLLKNASILEKPIETIETIENEIEIGKQKINKIVLNGFTVTVEDLLIYNNLLIHFIPGSAWLFTYNDNRHS